MRKQRQQQKRPFRTMTTRELKEIRAMLSSMSVPMIADVMDRDPSHIHKIRLGRIHKGAR